jgi:hypothetical protein
LPNSIKILIFGKNFNQEIQPLVLPRELRYLYLGYNFNYPVNLNNLPTSLRVIEVSSSYSSKRARQFSNYSYPIVVPENCIIVDNDDEFEDLLHMNNFNEIEKFLMNRSILSDYE